MKRGLGVVQRGIGAIAFFACFGDLSSGFFWQQIAPSSAVPPLAAELVCPGNRLCLATKPTVESVLMGLPRPSGAPTRLGTLFAANAYEQKSLNFQVKSKPQPAVDFYRKALGDRSYSERTVNATIGDWGFSVVFDSPENASFTPKDASKKVVLVIQGTMLGPDTLNLNIRFEEI